MAQSPNSPRMTNLATHPCRHCSSSGLALQPDGRLVCPACGAANALDEVPCPYCEHLSPAEAPHCDHCRQPLTRTCPACGASNWSGAEQCVRCSASLDAVTVLSNRLGLDPALRFNEQQRKAPAIKEQEARSSKRRLAELSAADERRRADVRAAEARRAAEQRIVLIGTGLFVLAIVVVVGLSALLTNLP